MTSPPPPEGSTYLFRRCRSPQRFPVALLAATTAVAHLPVIGPHLSEAPYMALLFIALTAACLVLAGIVLVVDFLAVYAAVGAICALAVAGYVATRLVPFPLLADDVGNWFEPLGVIAVTAETGVVIVTIWALAAGPRDAEPAPLVQNRHI